MNVKESQKRPDSPAASREFVLRAIKVATERRGGMQFSTIRRLEQIPGVFFGLGVDIVDVLIAREDMGELYIDLDNERIVALQIPNIATS